MVIQPRLPVDSLYRSSGLAFPSGRGDGANCNCNCCTRQQHSHTRNTNIHTAVYMNIDMCRLFVAFVCLILLGAVVVGLLFWRQVQVAFFSAAPLTNQSSYCTHKSVGHAGTHARHETHMTTTETMSLIDGDGGSRPQGCLWTAPLNWVNCETHTS